MVKNFQIKTFRVTKEIYDSFVEASKKLNIKQPDLARFLFVRALKQLQQDSIKAKGFENLDITIRNI